MSNSASASNIPCEIETNRSGNYSHSDSVGLELDSVIYFINIILIFNIILILRYGSNTIGHGSSHQGVMQLLDSIKYIYL